VYIYISEIIWTSGGSQIRTSEGSQFRTSGGSQSFSDKFKISSCCPNDSMLSSIDINNIAMSHTPNGSTQNQCQSLSVPLAQQFVNRTLWSADLDTPRDIIDDISSTLIHTSDQDINNVADNQMVMTMKKPVTNTRL
jgi:hypothetical protein